jgi:hypothetical protein
MKAIQLTENHFRFLEDFFTEGSRRYFHIDFDPSTMSLWIQDDNLAYLLDAFKDGKTAILPYLGADGDELLLADTHNRRFERISSLLERFLLPSYGEYLQAAQSFEADSELLYQRLGVELFPAGYSRFRILRKNVPVVLERMRRMLDMQQRDAPRLSNPVRNYRELYSQFQTALAAESWDMAARTLTELQQESLISAENLNFLRIQLLAQQNRWKEIFALPNYADLSRLQVLPRLVRGALLTAFHVQTLLQHETAGELDLAYGLYRLERGKLGQLLTGHYGLNHDSVLRIFAYEAAQAGDREQFTTLEAEAENTETRQILANLAKHLPPPVVQVSNPLEAAKVAIALRQFDKSFEVAQSLENGVEKTYLLLELLFQSQDVAIAAAAEDAYTSLNATDTDELLLQAHVKTTYLPLLESILQPSNQPDLPTLSNLLAWFEYVQTQTADKHYARACLDRLIENQAEARWTTTELRELSEILSHYLDKEQTKDSLLGDAFLYLNNQLLTDDAFPRSQAPYPLLYAQIFKFASQRTYNELHSSIVLKLAEVVLEHNPDELDLVALELMDWFAKPLPALEAQILETFELLADYGMRGTDLSDLYQTWLDKLSEAPKARPMTYLETWRRLADWVHAPQYLRDRLEQAVQAIPPDVIDPIANLPEGYRVVIYSLRQDSADMAKQRLLERNRAIEVEICSDKVGTERAYALAAKADLAVVVTHSLKHALYYAIWSLVEEKAVRPASSGTTSILRAIEERLGFQL